MLTRLAVTILLMSVLLFISVALWRGWIRGWKGAQYAADALTVACLLFALFGIHRTFTVEVGEHASLCVPCITPMTYRLGAIDPRFGVSEEEALEWVDEVVFRWEVAAPGGELFTYDPEGKMVINFVYDERQAVVDEGKRLDAAIDQLQARYDEESARLDAIREEIDKRIAGIERRQADVDRRMATGELEELRKENDAIRRELEAAREEMRARDRLRESVEKLSAELREKLSEKIKNLETRIKNSTVGRFNQQEESWTIDIFTFDDEADGVNTLAHEFGHALGIPHLAHEGALMHKSGGSFSMYDIAAVQENADVAWLVSILRDVKD